MPTIAVRKKKLGSYPYLTVVLSITLALFVIGLFGLLVLHASALAFYIRSNFELQVFLERDHTENQRISLHKTLTARPYVGQDAAGAPTLQFISRDEAARQMIDESGEDFVALLGENPLRDAYALRLRPEYLDDERLAAIRRDIEKQEGVYEVTYVENMASVINNNLAKISLVLLTFAGVLLVTDTLLINNTIKLALFSQRFIIRSMQLVGATDGFIQRPFLKRALWQGLLSGVMAVLMLHLLLQYALTQIPELSLLQRPPLTYGLYGALVLLGVLIGFVSAYLAVRRYLRMSLDNLY